MKFAKFIFFTWINKIIHKRIWKKNGKQHVHKWNKRIKKIKIKKKIRALIKGLLEKKMVNMSKWETINTNYIKHNNE